MKQMILYTLSIVQQLLLVMGLRAQDSGVSGQNAAVTWGAYNRPEKSAGIFQGNKAALARATDPSLAITGERPYSIAGIGRYRISLALPAGTGSFGLQAGLLKAGGWSETMFAIGYGRTLGPLLSAGVQAGWIRGAVAGYAPANTIVADLGLIIRVMNRVNAGWNISLPHRPGRPAGRDGQPVLYGMGIGYDASENWCAALEISHSRAGGTVAAVGFIYRPVPPVQVRMGFGTGGPPVWLGLGYSLGIFRVLVSVAWHDRLGTSPAMTIERYFNASR